MKRKTIIIIGVSIAVLIVTGAIVAIVLLQKKDDDPDTTTSPPIPSPDEGQNGSTGGGANGDSTASQELETWNRPDTLKWNHDLTMEFDLKEQQASEYKFTKFSKDDLGANVDDAREMCLQYAHDINDENQDDIHSPVCGISFYPLAYGTTADKTNAGVDHSNYPCNIFSNCTSNYPSVIDAKGGSQTLFTDPGLFCERGEGSNAPWRTTIGISDPDNVGQTIFRKCTTPEACQWEFGSGNEKCKEGRCEDTFESTSWNMMNLKYLNESKDDDGVIKIARDEFILKTPQKNVKISDIRGQCLTIANTITGYTPPGRSGLGVDSVCGVNFYPRAFVTTEGDPFINGNAADDGNTGIQGNNGWSDSLGLSEDNYNYPCQIFINCDSNPGYTAMTERGEALFTRPFIRCNNNSGGEFFD